LSGKAPTLVQHSKPLPSGPQEAGHTGNSIRSVVSSRSVCDSDSMREAVGTTLLSVSSRIIGEDEELLLLLCFFSSGGYDELLWL